MDSQAVPLPGERDRRCDTVAWFDRPNGDAPPLAVVIEFLSRPCSDVLERLSEYTLAVRRELPLQHDPLVRYDVIGVLVNLTGEMSSGSWGMKPPDTGDLGLSDRVGLRNLSTWSAHDVLKGVRADTISRSVLALLPLLAGADDPEVAREWAELAIEEPDLRIRADLGGLAKVFADLADRRSIWNPLLEGWNVERSAYVEEIETRGQVKALRATILRILGRRPIGALPAELVEAVQQQKDLATLERWIDQVITVSSLDEARAALGLNGA